MATTVLLVDDHPMILRGVISLLELEDDLKVVGSCTDGNEALVELERLKPDILILDLGMESMGGLEVLRRLPETSPDTKAILLTASVSKAEMLSAVELGAHCILLKEEASEDLLNCIRGVLGGRRVFNHRFLEGALEAAIMEKKEKQRAEERAESLTDREGEIAHLVSTGLSNKSIARQLGISEGTVKLHLHKVFRKLGVSNRVRLTLFMKEKLTD